MRVFSDLNALPSFQNSAVTIGSFDGVHLGHQKILKQLKSIAKDNNGESVVITFYPHPRIFLNPQQTELKLLQSIEEKINRLESIGIDNLVIVPFDKIFSSQSPEDYIHNFLIDKFHPKSIVIGYDHKFGKNRAGNIELLKKELNQKDISIIEIQKEEINDLAISSTKVRKAIATGDMQLAADLLGHNYSLYGTVKEGEKLGKQLGFPTANLKLDEVHKLIPEQGIYAVTVDLPKMNKFGLEGMMYIGQRPTVDHINELTIEVNIFDFDDNIYEHPIQVDIKKYIRGDQKYNSFDELKSAIQLDQQNVQAYFSSIKKKPTVTKAPEVAVVILNYNGKDHLAKYMPSVLKTKYDNLRIVVADNASTDDSVEFLKINYPNIELQLLDENYGFTGGYKKSLAMIDSEYLVLLNSDVRVEVNWLEEAMKVITKNPSIAVVQPKIRSDRDPVYFEYAGAAGGWIDRWGFPFCRGRLFQTLEKDLNQYDDEINIFWASGCAFLVRNEVYKKVGGLDPQFFAHLEEIDLCWRIQRMGYQIKFAPKSIVYHLGGGTLSYQNPRKTFLNFRNSLIMVAKNKSGFSLFANIVIRLLLDGVAGIKFLLSGQPKDCWAIIRAHFSFYGKIGTIRKRRAIESLAISTNQLNHKIKIAGWYQHSIVYEYFIKGKKYFSDLNGEK